jgi:hypothetical protein
MDCPRLLSEPRTQRSGVSGCVGRPLTPLRCVRGSDFALPARRGFIPSFPFDKNGEEEWKEKDGWRRRDEPAPGAIAVACPDYAVRALDRRSDLIPR